VDSEPHFAEKLKAIRDKKERFFESRNVAGGGGIFVGMPRGKPATGG
jgi:hypothetical protein